MEQTEQLGHGVVEKGDECLDFCLSDLGFDVKLPHLMTFLTRIENQIPIPAYALVDSRICRDAMTQSGK